MIKKSAFKAAWWLPNPHLQTIWPVLNKPRVALRLKRERVELPDGDFLDLDWATPARQHAPIAIVLHGLEGSIDSPYSKGMLRALRDRGYRSVLLHFRGCSGEPNRLPRAYHSGDTMDLAYVVERLRERYPDTFLMAIGYSLGGNALLKWLGETQQDNPLSCAVAISVPFELEQVTERLSIGFSRVYQRRLLRQLHRKFIDKTQQLALPLDIDTIKQLKTFKAFDNYITAPLHGFVDAKDYYQRSSSRQFLKHIAVPTLILHALDDPFMYPSVIPTEEDLSPHVCLELSQQGGHVGFVGGDIPGTGCYWPEVRVPDFLDNHMSALSEI